MKHLEMPVGAFIAAFLVVTPLPWHWRVRGVPTLAIIAWLFVTDIIFGVNTIIWAGNINVNDSTTIWCDITTKISIGASIALPIANACLSRNLEMIGSSRFVRLDSSTKRRRMIFDVVMCFGVPMIFMALHYIVQGHRFNIFEDFGCQPAIYESGPAVVLVWLPQLLPSFITLVYAALAVRHFVCRRVHFATHLKNSDSALTTNQYIRLVALSIALMCWGTSLTAVSFYSNIKNGLNPWVNWAFVHANFSRIDLYPTVGVSGSMLSLRMMNWWAIPSSSFVFFLFFGFGKDARREYSKMWMAFRRHILRRKEVPMNKLFPINSDSHPVYVSMVTLCRDGDEKKSSC